MMVFKSSIPEQIIKCNWSEYWLSFQGKTTPASMLLQPDFVAMINLNDKVIDLGCGYGRACESIAKISKHVTGIDLNASEIAEAEKAARRQNLPIKYKIMDATKLEFPDAMFDKTVMLGLLGGVDARTRKRIIKEAVRITKSGGYVYVSELLRKTGDAERDLEYQQDAKLTGEYGSNVVKDPAGNILYICYSFAENQLERLLAANGLSEIVSQVRIAKVWNSHRQENNFRKHISVWARK